MSEHFEGLTFLKQKYTLHNTPEAKSAAERTEARTGMRVPQKPPLVIDNYLHRFSEIIKRKDLRERERGIEALKRLMHSEFVVKPEEIPEAYWESKKRLMEKWGQGGGLESVEWSEFQKRHTKVIIDAQKESLDNWIDYLSSSDAALYPDWLKYWVFRNIVGLAKYDIKTKKFPKRTTGTVNPFPQINKNALAYVLNAVGKKVRGQATSAESDDHEFMKLLQDGNFGKLYAYEFDKAIITTEKLKRTAGNWVRYTEGSDAKQLVESIRGRETGWCTERGAHAVSDLEKGDYYVFYSNDENGNPVIPRVAIRMGKEGRIEEVRGIAPDQNLDPYIVAVVAEKLEKLPGGEAFEKKIIEMQRLNAIEEKMQEGIELDRDELIFLLEIDRPIEGFGDKQDPRIKDLQAKRNLEADMPIVFECSQNEIAYNIEQINSGTKAYVGELVPGIFNSLPKEVEYIYISFPKVRIHRSRIEFGGRGKYRLLFDISLSRIRIHPWALKMLISGGYTSRSRPKEYIDLVRLSIADLGFEESNITTKDIFFRANELGLMLCPPEIGPYYRMHYHAQPPDERLYVGMDPIAYDEDPPQIYLLKRRGPKLFLDTKEVSDSTQWRPKDCFLFQWSK